VSLVANLLILLANLAVFGLSLKVYTEVLKEKSQRSRRATPTGDSP
jgi:hypothetical protein